MRRRWGEREWCEEEVGGRGRQRDRVGENGRKGVGKEREREKDEIQGRKPRYVSAV